MIPLARRYAVGQLGLLIVIAMLLMAAGRGFVHGLSRHGPAAPHVLATLLGFLLAVLCLGLCWRTRPALSVSFWRWLFVGALALALVLMFRIGGHDTARAWLAFACTGWMTLLLLVHANPIWPQRLAGYRALRIIDLALTNVAVFLLLAELGLRAYGACGGQQLLMNEHMDACRLAPNRVYGGLLVTNSHGYASREFQIEKRPGVQRIAALGDSFTVGVVRQDRRYLSLLEATNPAIEVYNFGIAATGPREYDQILQHEVWAVQPDLVLVSLFVGNDILGWWRLPSTGRLDPKACRLFVLCDRAWRLLRENHRRRLEESDGQPIHQPLEFPPMSRTSHLEHEYARLAVCRKSEATRSERSWGRTLLHLDRIVNQCRQRSVPLAVVLIPDELQVSQQLLNEVLAFRSIPANDVDLDLPQRRLAAFFQDRRVPCLDLLPAFRGVPDAYKPRDTHWNEKGNRLAADRLGEWLVGW